MGAIQHHTKAHQYKSASASPSVQARDANRSSEGGSVAASSIYRQYSFRLPSVRYGCMRRRTGGTNPLEHLGSLAVASAVAL